jgi:hypothetical protein
MLLVWFPEYMSNHWWQWQQFCSWSGDIYPTARASVTCHYKSHCHSSCQGWSTYTVARWAILVVHTFQITQTSGFHSHNRPVSAIETAKETSQNSATQGKATYLKNGCTVVHQRITDITYFSQGFLFQGRVLCQQLWNWILTTADTVGTVINILTAF